MVKFPVNGKDGRVVITLPSNLSEITPDYLNDVTSDVEVADNYALIGVCYKDKLFNIIAASRKNQPTNIATVPIFIKGTFSEQSHLTDNLKTGNKIIISGSQISLGYHVACPRNKLTINNFLYYVENDNTAYHKAATTFKDTYVYFLEFKIVPLCDIVGVYKEGEGTKLENNPFEVKPDISIN